MLLQQSRHVKTGWGLIETNTKPGGEPGRPWAGIGPGRVRDQDRRDGDKTRTGGDGTGRRPEGTGTDNGLQRGRYWD